MDTLKDEEANCKGAECLSRISHASVRNAHSVPIRLPADEIFRLHLLSAMVFEVEFSIEGCDAYPEHAGRLLA